VIYHLTDPTTWAASLAAGEHTGSTRGVTLAEECYIHCSTAAQWPGVRERFYADAGELLLLHIEESLLTAPLVYEQIGGAPEAFPHVYGPIPLAAVVQVETLAENSPRG
jgi:glutathione S-transferase